MGAGDRYLTAAPKSYLEKTAMGRVTMGPSRLTPGHPVCLGVEREDLAILEKRALAS